MKDFLLKKIPRNIFFKLNFIIEIFYFFLGNKYSRKFIKFCNLNFKKNISNDEILIELNFFYSSLIPICFFLIFYAKN